MQTLLFKVGSKKKCGRQRALNAAPLRVMRLMELQISLVCLKNGFIDLLFNVKSEKTQWKTHLRAY